MLPQVDEANGLFILAILVSYITPPAIFATFLAVGLKQYLQLPRAWLLAMVTVIAASIFTLTAFTVFVINK
jgi:hypothetical protein